MREWNQGKKREIEQQKHNAIQCDERRRREQLKNIYAWTQTTMCLGPEEGESGRGWRGGKGGNGGCL